eukprot:417225-Rhodomonas_salina.1
MFRNELLTYVNEATCLCHDAHWQAGADHRTPGPIPGQAQSSKLDVALTCSLAVTVSSKFKSG